MIIYEKNIKGTVKLFFDFFFTKDIKTRTHHYVFGCLNSNPKSPESEQSDIAGPQK